MAQSGNVESFLKWASDLGVKDSDVHCSSSIISCLGHSLSISDFPQAGGRGLAATRDLRKGELILRVPKSALMTRESVIGNDHRLADALKMHPCLSSIQVLAVCLLLEMNKGRKSFWYPYLMQLPTSYDILASFGLFETKALQVDDAIWVTERVISKADSDWREATALMKQLELKTHLMTFKAWLWASATISSRTLHIHWDDAGCLCPVGDLFNYAAPGEEFAFSENSLSSQNGNAIEDPCIDTKQCDACSGRLTDGGYEENVAAYCFYAKNNYRKGEQVLLSYGTYTNLELLEHYGFLLNENPNDKVFIPLIDPNIFASHSWPADSLYIHHDGTPSFSLLSALRLWATPPGKRKSVGHLVYSGSQLSRENELEIMKWIITNCCSILKSLPSTVEDDQSLLHAIEKAQQVQGFEIPSDLPTSISKDLCEFSELMGLDCDGLLPVSTKVKRYIDKWRLAVQWRLRYKKTLIDCISFCNRTIQTVLTQ